VNLYNLAYFSGLAVSAPYWLIRSKTRHKVMQALHTRMGDVAARTDDSPAILIHAVSVGEINATKSLIDQLRKDRPDLRYIVSTTTQTGYERGEALYGKAVDVTLIRYPLDFTRAIARVLDRLRPSAVVLMELELWPNFMLQCDRRGIPVILANGRITEPSYRKYRRILPITRRMFGRLTRLCAQDETYAKRFIDLGAAPDRVVVAGTMKFDSATISDRIEGDDALAGDLHLRPGEELILVAGSTGPGEEQMILDAYVLLRKNFPALRLAIIPRHPQRFDEVAGLIQQRGLTVVRRSAPATWHASRDAVILGDTMGELRKFYSLADVVFVGRSLVDLGHRQHGSDMIEPAALAKPVIVGPFTTNFADAMLKFMAANSVIEVKSGKELEHRVNELLADSILRDSLGKKAQQVVREQQGSTLRQAKVVVDVLSVLPLS
jgi:3-deoxy-D-manno-octulosonic-acid transferase